MAHSHSCWQEVSVPHWLLAGGLRSLPHRPLNRLLKCPPNIAANCLESKRWEREGGGGTWLLHLAWAFLKHGGWVSRARILRQTKTETEGTRWKLHWFFWPSCGSHTVSLLPPSSRSSQSPTRIQERRKRPCLLMGNGRVLEKHLDQEYWCGYFWKI